MSEPIPVTNSAIVMLSGSASSAKSICSEPTGTHWKSDTTCDRSSVGMPRRSKYTSAVTTNDAAVIVVANQPARGSPIRDPNAISTRPPTSGKNGTSQTRSIMCSALQLREIVGGERGAVAHDRHDDAETDHHFGGGDDEDEEDD